MKDLSNNIIITYWEVFLELAVCKLLSRARDGERSSDRGRPDPWGRGGRAEPLGRPGGRLGRSDPLGRPGVARHDPWARNDREEQDRRRMDDVSRTTGEVCIKYISTTPLCYFISSIFLAIFLISEIFFKGCQNVRALGQKRNTTALGGRSSLASTVAAASRPTGAAA